jgi:lipoprotein-releasing system permease protein
MNSTSPIIKALFIGCTFQVNKFYELSLGLRYLRAKRRTQFVSFISLSSMLGIGLGVLALITVLSIMNGFEKELRERILAMTSHMTVAQGGGRLDDWPHVAEQVRAHPQVIGAAPKIENQALISFRDKVKGVLIKGVEPVLETQVSALDSLMLDGRLAQLGAGEFGIILGTELALEMGVSIGDKLTLVTPQAASQFTGMLPRMKRFTLVGIFEAGMSEYDSSLALIHLQDAQALFKMGDQVSGVELKLADLFAVWEVNQTIQNYLPEQQVYYTVNWAQQHANFFKALQMEKRMMFIVVGLIIAVAAFNIVSTMVMVVNDKRADIAILRTQGAQPSSILWIFLIQGMVIGLIGITLGGLGGVAIALHIDVIIPFIEQVFGVQFFPGDVYYISQIPSQLKWDDVWEVCGFALILSFLATLYPARMAAKTAPAEALRYE